ncbi:MAG: hypothetical protein M3Y48_14040 [Actinomycetota bacterium]|nr:hypothetical protein [Actinomycetota bacterium]
MHHVQRGLRLLGNGEQQSSQADHDERSGQRQSEQHRTDAQRLHQHQRSGAQGEQVQTSAEQHRDHAAHPSRPPNQVGQQPPPRHTSGRSGARLVLLKIDPFHRRRTHRYGKLNVE